MKDGSQSSRQRLNLTAAIAGPDGFLGMSRAVAGQKLWEKEALLSWENTRRGSLERRTTRVSLYKHPQPPTKQGASHISKKGHKTHDLALNTEPSSFRTTSTYQTGCCFSNSVDRKRVATPKDDFQSKAHVLVG